MCTLKPRPRPYRLALGYARLLGAAIVSSAAEISQVGDTGTPPGFVSQATLLVAAGIGRLTVFIAVSWVLVDRTLSDMRRKKPPQWPWLQAPTRQSRMPAKGSSRSNDRWAGLETRHRPSPDTGSEASPSTAHSNPNLGLYVATFLTRRTLTRRAQRRGSRPSSGRPDRL